MLPAAAIESLYDLKVIGLWGPETAQEEIGRAEAAGASIEPGICAIEIGKPDLSISDSLPLP